VKDLQSNIVVELQFSYMCEEGMRSFTRQQINFHDDCYNDVYLFYSLQQLVLRPHYGVCLIKCVHHRFLFLNT
jgi:hypothetical protein